VKERESILFLLRERRGFFKSLLKSAGTLFHFSLRQNITMCPAPSFYDFVHIMREAGLPAWANPQIDAYLTAPWR
jgi:hypothetical protein